MKTLRVIASAILVCTLGAHASAQRDTRTFTRILESWNHPRAATVHVNFEGMNSTNLEASQEGTGNHGYVKLWDGLYLHVYGQGHAQTTRGAHGYHFALSANEAGDDPLLPMNQPGHGITEQTVSAFHFRNRDNSGPNEPGPKNVNAPGEFRWVAYDGLDMKIRLLAFTIVDAEPGRIPVFESLSCIVTVSEAEATKDE